MALKDPRHQLLLDYLMTPPAQRSMSQKDFAASFDPPVSDRTLRDWKEREDFKEAWRLAFKEVAGSVERTKALLDILYDDSTNPEASAADRARSAKLYLDASKAIAPPEPEKESRRAMDLTDEELTKMIAEHASAELEARS